MSIKSSAVLAIAALLLASPSFLSAQSAAPDASAEAAKMVPATAVFTSTVDSQKAKPGTQVKIQLKGKVKLGNGSELPSGTVLLGQVVDESTQSGKAKLALRFTEATLKNGQTVPLKVTIFSIRNEVSMTEAAAVTSIDSDWDKKSVGVDQAEIMPSIDLHSKIASPDSGVFVSKKDSVKFTQGSRIGLAIAPRGSEQSEYGY